MAKVRSATIHGAMFIILGVAGLVHPRIMLPAKTDVIQIGNSNEITETRSIITIPAFLSVLVMVGGGALIFRGTRKPE